MRTQNAAKTMRSPARPTPRRGRRPNEQKLVFWMAELRKVLVAPTFIQNWGAYTLISRHGGEAKNVYFPAKIFMTIPMLLSTKISATWGRSCVKGSHQGPPPVEPTATHTTPRTHGCLRGSLKPLKYKKKSRFQRTSPGVRLPATGSDGRKELLF